VILGAGSTPPLRRGGRHNVDGRSVNRRRGVFADWLRLLHNVGYLTQKYAKKPVVVVNYPKAIKAFYMRVNDDGWTVTAMDVLAPGIGEIIGGSQREERLEVLDQSMAERGIDHEHYGWYRDLRRYGTVLACGLRSRLRAYAGLRHRPFQCPRRDPLPAHAGQRKVSRHMGPQKCPRYPRQPCAKLELLPIAALDRHGASNDERYRSQIRV
jgi:hypothetical protein